MSPEQVRGQTVDHRSDIFSFGVVLYEMLTGRRAFQGDSAVETMNAILKAEPPPASDHGQPLPPALDRIVLHCLEKNPEERFQSARDVAFDIEALSSISSQGVPRRSRDRKGWLRPAAVAVLARPSARRCFWPADRTPVRSPPRLSSRSPSGAAP
jgi:serine/threonine protein kinase